VQFASAPYIRPSINDGPQWLARIDRYHSEAHRLSWRYLFDSRVLSPTSVQYPGFLQEDAYRHQNFLFADSYTFGPSYTNEFRLSYGRQDADDYRLAKDLSVPQARTLPVIGIANLPQIGASSNLLTFRRVNKFLIQETQTKVLDSHTFRYGVEFLRQLSTELPGGFTLGLVNYTDALSSGYSAFANFLAAVLGMMP
jgi:hypothetical protein